MFERRHEPLLPRLLFLLRMVRSVGAAVGIVLVALAIGTLGYRGFENMAWIDALLNAAMILSGMGPTAELHTTGGKLFASIYALLSGFVFLTIAGLMFAPLLHRMIHKFHLQVEAEVREDQERS